MDTSLQMRRAALEPTRHDAVLITTRQAALLFDVHASTVKRWCDTGDMPCQHTPGGHRRIGLDSMLDFATQRGLATALDPFGPQAARVWQAARAAVNHGRMAPMVGLWKGWLHRDEPAYLAPSILLLLRWDVPLPRVFDHGIQALMTDIGESWQAGHLRIGDEHRMTEQVLDALHRLRLKLGPPAPEAPVAVVCAAQGNRHQLGAFMVRLLLESRGWSVRYLGADVPADELLAQQRQVSARMVCASFSRPQSAVDARRLANLLAFEQSEGPAFHLVMGGNILAQPIPDFDPGPFLSAQVFTSMVVFASWLDGMFRDVEPTRPLLSRGERQ